MQIGIWMVANQSSPKNPQGPQSHERPTKIRRSPHFGSNPRGRPGPFRGARATAPPLVHGIAAELFEARWHLVRVAAPSWQRTLFIPTTRHQPDYIPFSRATSNTFPFDSCRRVDSFSIFTRPSSPCRTKFKKSSTCRASSSRTASSSSTSPRSVSPFKW